MQLVFFKIWRNNNNNNAKSQSYIFFTHSGIWTLICASPVSVNSFFDREILSLQHVGIFAGRSVPPLMSCSLLHPRVATVSTNAPLFTFFKKLHVNSGDVAKWG